MLLKIGGCLSQKRLQGKIHYELAETCFYKLVVAFHKKDYPEKSIMSLWRQDEAFDRPFSITKKKHTHTHKSNQTSITLMQISIDECFHII